MSMPPSSRTWRVPPRIALLSLALILILALGVWQVHHAWAAGYTVTTLADNTNDDGACSLREAILAANNNPANDDCGNGSAGDDTITFAVNGTISLNSTLPEIKNQGSLTIDGSGHNITIDGGSSKRLFQVGSGATLTLVYLTLSNGKATSDNGGAIESFGSLTLDHCQLTGNQADKDGGAVYQNGATLQVKDSIFENNRAGESGGGIFFFGDQSKAVTISGSTFKQNTAADSWGGGVYLRDFTQATIQESTFEGNTSEYDGGGLAIVDGQTATIEKTRFKSNQAGDWEDGGGLYVWATDKTKYSQPLQITVKHSTFDSNTAPDGEGGGISFYNDTDFDGERNGQGIQATIVNSTFRENNPGAVHFSGRGDDSILWLHLYNTTIAYNHDYGVKIENATDATPRTIQAVNTIVAHTNGSDCDGLKDANFTDQGHNLSGDDTCPFTAAGSQKNTDPKLDTFTGVFYPLKPDSPALDAGDNNACADAPVNNQSQNGVTRPKDGNGDGQAVCDIGSYEAPEGGTPTPTPSPTPTSTPNAISGQKPAGQLTANAAAWPLITWTMTWANIYNTQPLRVLIVNSIPPNMTFVSGSLHCTGTGGTTVHTCTYRADKHLIEVEATLAADYGGTFSRVPTGAPWAGAFPPAPFTYLPAPGVLDVPLVAPAQGFGRAPAALHSPLTVTYQTQAVSGTSQVVSQAVAYWDENGDDQVNSSDPNVAYNTPVRSDDPAQAGSEDPTIVRRPAPPANMPETGFPPDRVTPLRPQKQPYANLGEVWIEIPRLHLRSRIWGVPEGADLSWLTEVGWLWGTAFPGHPGNSILTAHNYLATGTPGPFVHLSQLHYGDVIRIHAYGTVYEFSVRQVAYVAPESKWPLRPLKDGYAWLTLITCAQWDEADQAYRYRVVVRGVLVRWYQSGG